MSTDRGEPKPGKAVRIEVDDVVVQLAKLLDGSCIAGGLVPGARYQVRLENEAGEATEIVTANDGTFVVSDPPTGRLRVYVDAERRSGWVER